MTQIRLLHVLAVNLLLGTAVHAARPLVSYRALDLGAGPVELGLVGASYGLIALVMAFFIGRWVDRWGERPFMVVGSVGVSSVALLLAGANSVLMLAASMAALGLSQVLTAVSIQSLLANEGEPERRDARLAWQSLVASLGQVLGPIASGLIAGSPPAADGLPPLSGIRWAFILAAAAAVVGAVLAGTLAIRSPAATAASRSQGGRPVGSTTALRRVLEQPNMPQAMFASLAVLASVDILIVYLPAFAIENGIGIETVGLLLAVRAAGSMLSRGLVLPLRSIIGRRELLGIALLTSAVALGLFPLLATSMPAMFALMGMVGFGLGLGQPLTLSWMVARAPATMRGTAIGLRLTGNRLGQLAVPAAVGVVAGATGLAAVFWSVGTMLGACAFVVIRARFEDPETGEMP